MANTKLDRIERDIEKTRAKETGRFTRLRQSCRFYFPDTIVPVPAPFFNEGVAAVSYTHLDVYKRQHFLNPAHEVGGVVAALCNPGKAGFPCLLYTSMTRRQGRLRT